MEDRCGLCHRRRVEGSDYCLHHQRAFRNLEEKFEAWEEALDIDWVEFLKKASGMKETGEWAKGVAFSQLERNGG